MKISIDEAVKVATACKQTGEMTGASAVRIAAIRKGTNAKVLQHRNLTKRFSDSQTRLKQTEALLLKIGSVMENGANAYRETDLRLQALGRKSFATQDKALAVGAGAVRQIADKSTSSAVEKKKKDEKSSSPLFTWSDTWKFVGCAGILGAATATVGQAVTGGKSAENFFKVGKSFTKFVGNVAKAIPKSVEDSFDLKALVGFNSAITKDTPTTFIGALAESVDKLNIGKATTVSDKVAVAAKWAGYGLTGALTVYENITDTEENNSWGRKIAESIGETTVKIGEDLLIGAALTAAFGVGTPAVVVGAVTVGATWAADTFCEAATGKDVAELVSDTVLDTGEAVIKAVGKGAKKVTGAVSGWWKKTFR